MHHALEQWHEWWMGCSGGILLAFLNLQYNALCKIYLPHKTHFQEEAQPKRPRAI